MSVPSQRFAFEGAVSPGGTFPPIGGVPLDEPSPGEGLASLVGWTTKTKKANEDRTLLTTLTNDATLQFGMTRNSVYRIRIMAALTTANATPDFRFGINILPNQSANLFLFHGVYDTPLSGGNVHFSDQAPAAIRTVNVAIPDSLIINYDGIVHSDANGGTFVFRWCQGVSSASATTLRAGAYIEYARV